MSQPNHCVILADGCSEQGCWAQRKEWAFHREANSIERGCGVVEVAWRHWIPWWGTRGAEHETGGRWDENYFPLLPWDVNIQPLNSSLPGNLNPWRNFAFISMYITEDPFNLLSEKPCRSQYLGLRETARVGNGEKCVLRAHLRSWRPARGCSVSVTWGRIDGIRAMELGGDGKWENGYTIPGSMRGNSQGQQKIQWSRVTKSQKSLCIVILASLSDLASWRNYPCDKISQYIVTNIQHCYWDF